MQMAQIHPPVRTAVARGGQCDAGRDRESQNCDRRDPWAALGNWVFLEAKSTPGDLGEDEDAFLNFQPRPRQLTRGAAWGSRIENSSWLRSLGVNGTSMSF